MSNEVKEVVIGMAKIIEGKNLIIDRQARQLAVANNALDNIFHWKTFGVQNNPHELVSHAHAAIKEIAEIGRES